MTTLIVGLLQQALHIATNTSPLEKHIVQMKVFLDVRYSWNWLYQYSNWLNKFNAHKKLCVDTLCCSFNVLVAHTLPFCDELRRIMSNHTCRHVINESINNDGTETWLFNSFSNFWLQSRHKKHFGLYSSDSVLQTFTCDCACC